MLLENTSSDLFSVPPEEQLLTDFSPEEAAMINGGQLGEGRYRGGRARSYLENRAFREGCDFFDEDIEQYRGRTYLTFSARCPIQIGF